MIAEHFIDKAYRMGEDTTFTRTYMLHKVLTEMGFACAIRPMAYIKKNKKWVQTGAQLYVNGVLTDFNQNIISGVRRGAKTGLKPHPDLLKRFKRDVHKVKKLTNSDEFCGGLPLTWDEPTLNFKGSYVSSHAVNRFLARSNSGMSYKQAKEFLLNEKYEGFFLSEYELIPIMDETGYVLKTVLTPEQYIGNKRTPIQDLRGLHLSMFKTVNINLTRSQLVHDILDVA